MKLTVNGIPHEVASPPLRPLLHVLREELDVTGPKAGCQQGSCGTCTVLVDGEPRRSCLVPLALADGAEITTVEGLGDPRRLHALQAAFFHYYGAQCGFCTPGMITAAYALLQRNPSPTRMDIQEALGGHICRCTGYVKIIDAIEAVARGETFAEADRTLHSDPNEPEVAIKGAPA
jgi:carbon-monoxide dehydrogenase small subunit